MWLFYSVMTLYVFGLLPYTKKILHKKDEYII